LVKLRVWCYETSTVSAFPNPPEHMNNCSKNKVKYLWTPTSFTNRESKLNRLIERPNKEESPLLV